MFSRNNVKILLLQLRGEEATMREEHENFAQFAEIDIAQIDVLNVFQIPEFSNGIVGGYHGMFIGGSSSVTVLQPEKYPFIHNCVNLIHYCIHINLPVFASCFGHQLVALAFGSKVERIHGKNIEKGTIPIKLTQLAKNDILFHDIPDGFLAVSVHKEFTKEVPNNCKLLAYTDSCTHSFKVKDKPFWTSQFHPEVDKDILVKRLSPYWQEYFDTKEELHQVFASTKETPLANSLLKKFVDRVIVEKSNNL